MVAQGLLEFLAELLIFLVTPAIAERDVLAMQPGQGCLEFRTESLQIMSEPAKFVRVDDGLSHGGTLSTTDVNPDHRAGIVPDYTLIGRRRWKNATSLIIAICGDRRIIVIIPGAQR